MRNRKLVNSLAAVAIVCWTIGIIRKHGQRRPTHRQGALLWVDGPLIVLLGLAAMALARSARRRNA